MGLTAKLLIRGLDRKDFDFDIEAYSGGLSQSGTPVGPGPPDQGANFQDFALTRRMDRHSPRLARACAQGITIERATLELSDNEGRRVMEYRLSDCLVSSFQAGGSSNYDRIDQFSLSYGTIEWVYIDPETGEEFAERATVRQPVTVPGRLASQFGTAGSAVPNSAFIVMWMDPDHSELEDVCHAIKEVCRQFGVAAVRADDIEHSDQITELVLSRIASSEFVIADLTGERPNVYYEVGYAQAIGKRPILIRRQETRIHFDLSVHNVRAYKNITQLKDLLGKRFEAIMGRSFTGDPDA
jgi:type VI protein secretion system component Hcp